MGYQVGEDGLSIQDAESLDPTTLTPLSPEVISRQATINIGACARFSVDRGGRMGNGLGRVEEASFFFISATTQRPSASSKNHHRA